jgi:hypothetical protein
LEQRISIDVKNVTMHELLRQAAEQAGLSFELRGRAVRLFPNPSRRGDFPKPAKVTP